MDFVGTTTQSTIMTGWVIQGTQITGDFLWPFFMFLGIPLAFAIATFIVAFIRAMMSKDRSQKFMGVYVHDVPYKGYNRWRSASWNARNTM